MLKQRIVLTLFFSFFVLGFIPNTVESGNLIPFNQFNIGDSIGEGEAADGTIGQMHHDMVWSTDIVYSLNERFDDACPTDYYENDAARDAFFNHAKHCAVTARLAVARLDLASRRGDIPQA